MSENDISCECDSDLDLEKLSPSVFQLKDFIKPILSLVSLAIAYLLIHFFPSISKWFAIALLLLSYLLVGWDVIKKALYY